MKKEDPSTFLIASRLYKDLPHRLPPLEIPMHLRHLRQRIRAVNPHVDLPRDHEIEELRAPGFELGGAAYGS